MSGYIIQGGQVFDGGGGPPAQADVRVRGEKIVEIGPALPPGGETPIDARGLLVTPGLIDLHAHVYSGMGVFSVDPEDAGLSHGVTTLLDTGTAGALTYPTFHRFIIGGAKEDIFALLNISMIGAIQNHFNPPHTGELTDARHAHVESAVACIEKYRDRIVGTKVRLTSGLANDSLENEQAGLRGAVEAAARTGLPCMVHHALSKIPPAEVLAALRPGDIYTHLYHPYADNLFDAHSGAPRPEAVKARERGIILDVGHGGGAFAWAVAEPACRQHGFWPDTISTDVHAFNLHGPVFDMATTMSKFLCLGMPLPQLIRAVTAEPARAMRLDGRFGRLLPQRQADITLLRVERGSFELMDVKGQARTSRERFAAAGVLKRGVYHGRRA